MGQDLQFLYPNAAYLLPVVALLLYLLHREYQRRQLALSTFAERSILRSYALLRHETRERLRAALIAVGWIFACIALMKPVANVRYLSEPSNAAETSWELTGELTEEEFSRARRPQQLVILMDASASMSVADTRQGLSRLDLAKELVDELIARLDGPTVAVYAFTSSVSTVSPPTLDYLYARFANRRIRLNEGERAGTDFLEALEFIKEHHPYQDPNLQRTLVILSDGGDTRLESLAGDDRRAELETIISRLDSVDENQFQVFTLGLGSRGGAVIPGLQFDGQPVRSSLDEELLERLANQGKGRYFFVNDYSVLDIAEYIAQGFQGPQQWLEENREGEQVPIVEQSGSRPPTLVYDDYSQIFALLAALCLAAAYLLPLTRQVGGSAD
jgi:Ca-activated chloride channel family protein